jgi:peptidoglycan/LPS O-acetylase OafA/YrhL
LSVEAKYRPEIDGLRAVAILPVVFYHAGFSGFSGGFLGVDVFFVISGYLITRLIDAEIAGGRFSIVRFYERRVRRILPALYLVVLVSLIFAWLWLFPHQMQNFARSVVAIALFGSNVYFNQEIGYFTADVELWPLIHTWSLAVEEQFYAVFPLLLLALRRFSPKATFAAVAVLSAATLVWAQAASGTDPQADFYLPQFRAWELGAGALVALAKPERLSVAPWLRWGLAALGAALLVLSYLYAPRNLTPSLWSLAPVGGAALMIAGATPDNAWGRLLGAKPLVGVGLISYSAYLWHQPLFAFARFRFNAPPASWTMLLLGLASFLLAYVSWRFVERPFRDRARFSRAFVFIAALVVGVGLIVAGRVIVVERGFPARLAPIVGADDIGAYGRNCLGLADLNPAALARRDACRLGARDAAPDFLLIGDSRAAALADGVDAAARRAGRSGLLVGSILCMPILGVEPTYPPAHKLCRPLHAAVLDLVDKLGVKLFVMHAAWETMDGPVEIDDEASPRPASEADIRTRLIATLSALAARGVKVVIVTGTPGAAQAVPEFLARKERYGFEADARLERSQFLESNRTAFRLFADPEVRRLASVIDLYPFFCGDEPDARCAIADGPHPYFFDTNHLTVFGSMALSPLLEKAFP